MDDIEELPPDANKSGDGRTSPRPAEPTAASAIYAQMREQRLGDYHDHSLCQEDPLEANLGATNADLMRLAHTMQQAITRAVAVESVTTAELLELAPAVDQYLRVVKQTDRFSQLALKLRASREGSDQLSPIQLHHILDRIEKSKFGYPPSPGGDSPAAPATNADTEIRTKQ